MLHQTECSESGDLPQYSSRCHSHCLDLFHVDCSCHSRCIHFPAHHIVCQFLSPTSSTSIPQFARTSLLQLSTNDWSKNPTLTYQCRSRKSKLPKTAVAFLQNAKNSLIQRRLQNKYQQYFDCYTSLYSTCQRFLWPPGTPWPPRC